MDFSPVKADLETEVEYVYRLWKKRRSTMDNPRFVLVIGLHKAFMAITLPLLDNEENRLPCPFDTAIRIGEVLNEVKAQGLSEPEFFTYMAKELTDIALATYNKYHNQLSIFS